MMTAEKPLSEERIRTEFLRTGEASRALGERTALVDRLVTEAGAACLLPSMPEGIALLAVGGYGRRQLFPYSDVDLLLLVESDQSATAARDAISDFLQRLWDAGLRVSQSVRTPSECAELHDRNAELNISLLDQRFLTGDRKLYARVTERLPRFVHGNRAALFRNLSRLTRERHARYHDTFYHLEPNIKEGPGGLRDYQLVRWLTQIRQPGEAPEPAPELEQSQRFLTRLRCCLHYQAGRDQNVLSFQAQESAAEHWGCPDPAAWMRDYYRHARAVSGAALRLLDTAEAQASSLFSQFRDWRSRLSNAEFTVSRERLHFRSPLQLEADPELLLRMFEFVARHGVRLSLEAEQRIAARLPQLARWFSHSRRLWPALHALLALPHAPLALRAMHDTGALVALFPELRQIDCLVVRDFYHRYTVDEHTLVAIQTLCELRDTPDPARRAYADLFSELDDPATLIVALLFHDAGKAPAGGPHVQASVAAAESAMQRIGAPVRERETVRFLIGRHLDLSAAMHTRDLYDPATARELAHRVGTVERLKALTLLTWADISAVNPAAMTRWRAEQLWQLYLVLYNELTRELESERIAAEPAASPEAAAFLEGLPTRYLRTHTPVELEAHVALDQAASRRGVAMALDRFESAWRLTLVAADRPYLFASLAGTLSAFGLNILKAEAFANRRGAVLDTFTFVDPARSLDLNPTEVDRLRAMLDRVVLGKADVRQLLQNRPKPSPPSRHARVPASVSFDGEASGSATLIQIVAEDRPGLLYDLATAISGEGCNIEVVLIDTEAHKAIDVFYVTFEGGKLPAEVRERLGGALRRACQGVEPLS
jgi:[protein-PII] uridylyltransferase